MSSSRRQTWELQKDNSTQGRWNNWGLCWTIQRPRQTDDSKTTSRTNMVKRIMVSSETRRQATTTTTTQRWHQRNTNSNDKQHQSRKHDNKHLRSHGCNSKDDSSQKRHWGDIRLRVHKAYYHNHNSFQQQPKLHEVAPTGDYWIKEGHLWKRVHNIPRTNLYVPQQTHDGPDVSQLLPTRQTIIKPTSGARGYMIDDDWTTKTFAKLNQEWIGSRNFEVGQTYKDEYCKEQEEEQQPAAKAKGLKTPDQPTPQERAEHELTHLPFRSWCPTCVQSKGRSDSHPKQQSRSPVVQFDFCFFKALGEKTWTPILKQACSWQFWWLTSIKTFNVAGYKQYSTAPCYKQIKKTIP